MRASRSPSMMCCKTGLPCTSIIGLGSLAVSSRIRVPRPAARITAFSIITVSDPRIQDGDDEALHVSGVASNEGQPVNIGGCCQQTIFRRYWSERAESAPVLRDF